MADNQDIVKSIVEQERPLRAAEMQERQRSQSQLALATFRGLIIVNGGAIVALFTFIGNRSGSFDLHKVWWGFSFFTAGVVFVLGASLLAYFAEGCFIEFQFQEVWWAYATAHDLDPEFYGKRGRKSRLYGRILNSIGLCFAILSLFCFISGAGFVLSGVLIQ